MMMLLLPLHPGCHDHKRTEHQDQRSAMTRRRTTRRSPYQKHVAIVLQQDHQRRILYLDRVSLLWTIF